MTLLVCLMLLWDLADLGRIIFKPTHAGFVASSLIHALGTYLSAVTCPRAE